LPLPHQPTPAVWAIDAVHLAIAGQVRIAELECHAHARLRIHAGDVCQCAITKILGNCAQEASICLESCRGARRGQATSKVIA
jgi:hypothetical protein